MRPPVDLQADHNVQIVKDSETGTGFGNSIRTPCSPG